MRFSTLNSSQKPPNPHPPLSLPRSHLKEHVILWSLLVEFAADQSQRLLDSGSVTDGKCLENDADIPGLKVYPQETLGLKINNR